MVKTGVLPRTEKFCNLLSDNSFCAVRPRTEEKKFTKNLVMVRRKSVPLRQQTPRQAVCNRPADERHTTKVVQAPRTLQTEGLNFCNHIMSDLNKKVNQAIKLLKLAEESAMQKSIEREREREREVINELPLVFSSVMSLIVLTRKPLGLQRPWGLYNFRYVSLVGRSVADGLP